MNRISASNYIIYVYLGLKDLNATSSIQLRVVLKSQCSPLSGRKIGEKWKRSGVEKAVMPSFLNALWSWCTKLCFLQNLFEKWWWCGIVLRCLSLSYNCKKVAWRKSKVQSWEFKCRGHGVGKYRLYAIFESFLGSELLHAASFSSRYKSSWSYGWDKEKNLQAFPAVPSHEWGLQWARV